jgi:hypothetical protein
VKELFESSLSFIILAIIVSVRFVLFLRKRAAAKQAQERRQFQASPPPLAGVAAIEDEGATESEEESDDSEFSAWSLSVDSREGPPVQPVVPPAPVALPNDAGFSSQILPPMSLDIPEPVSLSEVWPEDFRTPAPTESNPAAGDTPKANGPCRRKFRTLPSLRQGVILSEILGPPKGL